MMHVPLIDWGVPMLLAALLVFAVQVLHHAAKLLAVLMSDQLMTTVTQHLVDDVPAADVLMANGGALCCAVLVFAQHD